MKHLLLITTLFFATLGCSAQASYYLSGKVDRKMYNDVKTYLESTTNPVIYISSPGGSRVAGEAIGDLVEKHKATCIVDNMAISAAFYIWAKCGRQEAMGHAVIMQHYPWDKFSGNLTYRVAQRLIAIGEYWLDLNFALVYSPCSAFGLIPTCPSRDVAYKRFKDMVENENTAGPELWNLLFPGFIEVIHEI